MAATGRIFEGWTEASRERIANQVPFIRHWKIVEGDCLDVEINSEATWFVDPPYNNRAGSYYVHSDVDYTRLGEWCKERRGQVIVCENEGAKWLPFRPFATFHRNAMSKAAPSIEVIWENDTTKECA